MSKFISVEGVEGVGKSTNLAFICDYLREAGQSVLSTREPGGTPFAEEIRKLLLKNREESVDSVSELLMVFAARAQHVEKVIRPSLNAGQWVVSDRFTDATYAYQGAGRGISMTKIAELEAWVLGDFRPDLTIVLDVDVEVGLERARQRAELDRFEREEREFFQRVREAYLARVSHDPSRYVVIDTTPSISEVQQNLERVLDKYLAVS